MSENPLKYDWDNDSAIWQAKNGDEESERTASAWVYIEQMMAGSGFYEANQAANNPGLLA